MKDWKEKEQAEETILRASAADEPTPESKHLSTDKDFPAAHPEQVLHSDGTVTESTKVLPTSQQDLSSLPLETAKLDESLKQEFYVPRKHRVITLASLIMFVMPFVLMGILQTRNPATFPYVYSQTIGLFSVEHAPRASLLSQAMRIRKDPIFAKARADELRFLSDPATEAADLQLAINAGLDKNSEFRYRLATSQFISNQPQSKIDATIKAYARDYGLGSMHTWSEPRDILLQLMSTDPEWLIKRSNELLNSARISGFKSYPYGTALRDRAIALRQLGKLEDAKKCLAEIKKVAPNEYTENSILSPALMAAIIKMDEGKTPSFDPLYSAKDGDSIWGAAEIYSAWSSYEQKKYAEARASAEHTLRELITVPTDYIAERHECEFEHRQRVAACHHLLERIYRAMGDNEKGRVEHDAYLATRCSGNLFTPLKYQDGK